MNKKTSSELNNLFIALALSMVVLIAWSYLIDAPRKKAEAIAIKAKIQSEQQMAAEQAKEEAVLPKTRAEWLSISQRVSIASESLHGSIALKGLRFDDLTLARYRQTLDPKSPEVVLFSPGGEVESYFAQFGWLAEGSTLKLPDADAVWTANGAKLTPQTPITFTWNNGAGVTFTTQVSLDEKYMFTVTQSAADAAGKPVNLRTYAYINRVFDARKTPVSGVVHEGPLGVFDGILNEAPYKKLATDKDEAFEAGSGWLAMSDKYWLSAIIPPAEPFTAHFSYYDSKNRAHFQADFTSPAQTVSTLHLFAGAKELAALEGYSRQYGIPLFNRAIDFGWFHFLTIPIFKTLTLFYAAIGNFGIAILALTVIVKLLLYPLASKSFRSMNQMKKVQPKMTELRERHKDDKMKLNQEIMALYKREKVNPASGCLPMLIQFPVMYSLYKVLNVSIEMRHAPFFGWIHDLSVPDPTNVFTFFGMMPWNTPALLHLGVWPLIMLATMLIQQSQSPPPPDPAQAKMMKIMPFFFLFIFAAAPAGLVIYWSWSNALSILQQAYIKHKHADDKSVGGNSFKDNQKKLKTSGRK